MSITPHKALSTADAYQRMQAHDPTLLTALRHGDPEVLEAVSRLLRLTPLARLGTNPGFLVAALVALPQRRQTLQAAWRRQDPILTSHLFMWVEQACRHHTSGLPIGIVAA